jgi:UDP-N-acetylglucosamine acyltransferase
MSIHPTAIVEDGAQIGAGCVIHPYAIVTKYAVLGAGVVVHPFAVIGGDPQYLNFDPAIASTARVGAGTVVREHVTVNRSIHPGKATLVGERCFIMANAHVAHDCVIGHEVVLANNVMLAGHVTVGDHCFVGGGVAVHQFVRLGEGSIISGLARMAQDAPPFIMAAERNEVIGLNLVGLKRRGCSRESIRELKDAFRTVYFTPGNIREVACTALDHDAFKTPEARQFLAFFTEGKRGFARARRDMAADEGNDVG